MVKFIISLSGAYLIANTGFGQQPQTIIWNTLQVPVQLSQKWQLQTDVSYRTIGASGSAYQYTARTGIRSFLNNKWNVATGLALFYTRTSFDKDNHEFGREFRLWQEVVKESRVNKNLSLINRFRTEERFFATTSVKNSFTAVRFRYRLAVVQRLAEKWKLQLSNEYMEQLSQGALKFQQNRLGGSILVEFNPLTQLQVGYIWSKLSLGTQHFATCTFIKTINVNGSHSKKR
jgi:Protein of unknown function (DUF2490)